MLMEEQAAVFSFDMVVERLLEAWGFLRRMPDREAGWIRAGGVSSLYRMFKLTERQVWNAFGHEAALEVRARAAKERPRLPGLTSAEVDRMDEALAWIEWVEPRDRRMVGLVLAQLDRGEARPAWGAIVVALASDVGPEALSARWRRAVSRIAFKVNQTETAEIRTRTGQA